MRWLVIPMLALAGCGRPELTVSVAASLHPAMEKIAARYGGKVQFNYGGSGALARQIVNGAPVDVLVSAGPKPVDELSAKGLLRVRRDLLRNSVVLIASNGAVTSWESLTGVQHIAIGDPESVPAGDYARQALRALGLWDRLQSKLILDQDVRQVLTHVASGNADAGIVYSTDATSEPKVRTVATADVAAVYPLAVLKTARKEADAFAAFLGGAEARAIFEAYGFTVIAP